MSVLSRKLIFAPGARVFVRDAEWVIRRVDQTSDGTQQLTCEGVTQLVRGQVGVFLTAIDRNITLLDPAKTRLVRDTSPAFARSRLFIESQLRSAVPSNDAIHVGHLAAMDRVPYQLDPARQALAQPRQRILIADAVGLGKTLEAGVLVSELIARGKGRRILVLAVKSMLTQFQKEFWNRFTIPLTRLDSHGIQRVRSHIPTNHNPFYYYDKTIISIDTLKQDREYRSYLEGAYWDIIVIDEAHNVADRGNNTLRANLAKLLAKRSDTLIMLSATPHDGKAQSFASLMNMLDPTAIVDPTDYVKDDFRDKGLVVRRFKKDIRHQVRKAFQDRIVHRVPVRSSAVEERAYEALLGVRAATARSSGSLDLFAVGLEKALFSSPQACIETTEKRIERQKKDIARMLAVSPNGGHSKAATIGREIEALRELLYALAKIDKRDDSRYQQLLKAIRGGQPFRWNGRKADDRLVIFTERIATMKWLGEQLQRDLGLKPAQVETLHGQMPDTDLQQVVDDFGNRQRPVRLLVCTDVASEGINLHFRCHRLIHYDMPWSLMVFQQRNGRIDRFGQRNKPEIVYLEAESSNETIRGDQRILEVLRDKDEQAYKNIGDPSVFMNVHSIEAEEEITGEAIATGEDAGHFHQRLEPESNEGDDLMDLFLGNDGAPATSGPADVTSAPEDAEPEPVLSVFRNDLAYCEAALLDLQENHPTLWFDFDWPAESLALDAPADLQFYFSYYPREIAPHNWRFLLTSNQQAMNEAIEESRKDEWSWPRWHYLWRQSPIVEWLNNRMLSSFRRHEAPVLTGIRTLAKGEMAFGFSGLVPNRQSHPLVYVWGAAMYRDGAFQEVISLRELLEKTGLGKRDLAARDQKLDLRKMKGYLRGAVDMAGEWIYQHQIAYEKRNKPKRESMLKELAVLKKKQLEHAEQRVSATRYTETRKKRLIAKKREEIDEVFDPYLEWVDDTMSFDVQPWIKIICIMTGEV